MGLRVYVFGLRGCWFRGFGFRGSWFRVLGSRGLGLTLMGSARVASEYTGLDRACGLQHISGPFLGDQHTHSK